jgi:transposase-like protein/DNA-directed RNA polymerase specialized sigma24 family protein
MSLVDVRDEFLAARASRGDGAAFAELARRYDRLLCAASTYPPPGLEFEDLRQEALIGLFEACRRKASAPTGPGFAGFAWFARHYVRWRVIKARVRARTRKHYVLSRATVKDAEAWQRVELSAPAPAASDPAVVVQLRAELRALANRPSLRALPGVRSDDGRRRYTNEQIDHALELVKQGQTLQQAALAAGVTDEQVGRWVRRARLQRTAGRHYYTDAEKAHALALVDAGASLAKAGAAVGATPSTVYKWRQKAAA